MFDRETEEVEEIDEIETPDEEPEEEETEEAEADEGEEEGETVDDEESEEEAEEESEESEGEEVYTVVIDDGDEEKEESPVINTLRKREREIAAKLKEAEARLAALEPKPEEVKKPVLADFEDDAAYEEAVLKWAESKRKADEQRKTREEREKALNEEWAETVTTYNMRKRDFGAKDYDMAEEAVRNSLEEEQQGVILDAAKAPEKVVYALGKNPELAAKFAKITNPVKLAVAIADFERKLKVEPMKKPKTKPERRVKGTSSAAQSLSGQLKRAEKEAEKSGDYTEVFRLQRLIRAKKES